MPTAPNPPAEGSAAEVLRRRLEERTATIAVMGLGYVGLPVCRALHDAGYRVLGFDVDRVKIEKLQRGENYIHHLGDDLARRLDRSDRFRATTDAGDLADADAVLLCVPTPLGAHREPDLSFVLDSTRLVAKTLRPGQLVILESTTYPGTTRGEMLPILAETGLTCGRDFFLGYSPEREDPGRRDSTTVTIPRLVGGVDPESTRLALTLYRGFVECVHEVASVEIAEAAKLLENVYRAVNIALVNELKVILTDMGIDVWDVISASATKPFGFQPFFPGPGLGGHCIPIDPFYLTWKAREIGHNSKFIELAGEINSRMPEYVIGRLMQGLSEGGKPVKDARILVLGVAYKPNVDDIRESPAADIISRLQRMEARVSYHDPHIATFPSMRRYDIHLDSVPLDESTIASHDCVLIITDHDAVDYDLVGRAAGLIVDTRNAMARTATVTGRLIKA